MAAPVNTITTASIVGIREDMEDTIYNVDPDETPLLSAIESVKVDNTFHEWQTDGLRSSADNAHIEGDDTTPAAVSPTVRVGNYTQIFKESATGSGTEAAVKKAGRSADMAYQLIKKGKEIKLDMERALFLNRARSAGSSVAPRYLGGLGSWINTNTSVGSGGADPTGNGTDARTDGTQRDFSQTLLDNVMQQLWTNAGKKMRSVYLGATAQNLALGFTGNNNQRNNVGEGEVIKDIVLYRTSFGTIEWKLSREHRARDVWVLDEEMLKRGNLRPMKNEPLAKTGDNEKRQIVAEMTLIVSNEAGHGGVFDLNT